MPPLKDRLDDLPVLARGLLDSIGRERGVDVSDVELDAELWQHTWPGNVRELRNYLEQMVILRTKPALGFPLEQTAETSVELTNGLDQMPLTAAKNELVARFEQSYVTKLLERTKGNVAEAARISGVNRATLFRMIRRYGLREEG
jgi:DNA-binding NtrC family response regulator